MTANWARSTTAIAESLRVSCRGMHRMRSLRSLPDRRAATLGCLVALVPAAAVVTGCGGRERPDVATSQATPENPRGAGTGAPPGAVSPIPDEWLGTFRTRVREGAGPAPGRWSLKVERAGRSDGTFTFTHVDVPKFSVPMSGRLEYGRLVVRGNPVSNCPSVGTYQVDRQRRGLEFTLLTDGCTDRSKFLTRVPWRPAS